MHWVWTCGSFLKCQGKALFRKIALQFFILLLACPFLVLHHFPIVL